MEPIKRIFIPSSQLAKRNLRPLSEYKGPVLKLTSFDKQEIEVLQKKIVPLEEKIRYYKKVLEKRLSFTYKNNCINALNKLYDQVEELKSKILDIKKNRFAQQKSGKIDIGIKI